MNVMDGKKIKLEMPTAKPVLNTIPFALGWLYILKSHPKTKINKVLINRGAEK